MQAPTLQPKRATQLRPPRDTSQPSFLSRTRSAVRDRLRGAIDPDAAGLAAAYKELTVGSKAG